MTDLVFEAKCMDELIVGNDGKTPVSRTPPSHSWSRFIIPRTRLGWYSIGFLIAFFVLQGILLVLPDDGSGKFSSDYVLSVMSQGMRIVSAFIAVPAIISSRERSLLVVVNMLGGIFIVLFLLGEVLIGHD